jgi:membrane-associated phospholipid phosphatase
MAGYFAFNDLRISEAIVNSKTGWAIFLEQYGELPGATVVVLGIMVFSIQYKNASFFKLAAIQFILLFASSLIFLYISYLLFFNISSSTDMFFEYSTFLLIAFLILSILLAIFFRKINLPSNLITISKIIIGMAFFGYLLSIQTLKFLWGRVRYRDLDILYSSFTEWYIANGIQGHYSFPSGHAAMGWILLPIFLLFINRNKYIRSVVLGLTVITAISISVSRVVIGAHYASDVLFGSFFMIVAFLILCKKYYLRN